MQDTYNEAWEAGVREAGKTIEVRTALMQRAIARKIAALQEPGLTAPIIASVATDLAGYASRLAELEWLAGEVKKDL